MKTFVKFSRNLLALAFIMGSLGGCSTIEGMGEDIEDAGEEIQDAADN